MSETLSDSLRLVEGNVLVAAVSAVIVDDQVAGDAVKPGAEGDVFQAIVGQALDHAGEKLARQVLGRLPIAQPRPGKAKEILVMAVVELADGGRLTALGALDQFTVTRFRHAASLSGHESVYRR